MENEKVAVFIDGANFLHALSKDLGRIDVDFSKLVTKMLGNRTIVRAYYYTAIPDQTQDPVKYKKQQAFLDALQKKDYFEVVKGRLEPRGNSYAEKGVDVALVCSLLEMAFRNTYDTAIIISGDGDFASGVQVVKGLGKHVENASTLNQFSRHLRQVSDKTILLSADYLKDCWKK